LRRRGYLAEEAEEVSRPGLDDIFEDHPELTRCTAASVRGQVAFGARVGRRVRRIGSGFGFEEEVAQMTGNKCAAIHGFTLHAGVHVGPGQRGRLEGLIRYIARGPLSHERLSLRSNGDVELQLKTAWSDGTTALVFSAEEFLERLVALVPPPRAHLVRWSGVLAPHSKWRSQIVKNRAVKKGFTPAHACKDEEEKSKVKNHAWSRLLARCFQVDVSTCSDCGGDLKIMAAILDHTSIERYLRWIGLDEHPPPIAPARYVQDELEFG
jgi:hypothetical protein